MWVRKRLDIGWFDIAAARLAWVVCWNRVAVRERLESRWAPDADGLACLSVRSGLDLLLSALDWPAGSEVLMSALTVPDMARIVAAHDLVPVPVDLDPDTAAATSESLRRAVSPATRGVLVAHLFGGRAPLDPVFDRARDHGLFVIEDCAQAYVGPGWRGSEQADASLFSFGTIKTATAVGGALLRIADSGLLGKVREIESAWPVGSRLRYLLRVRKSALLKLCSSRAAFSLLANSCRLAGRDHDTFLNRTVRGFPGKDLLGQLRQQAPAPMLALLDRRLSRFAPERLAERAERGARLVARCGDRVRLLGHAASEHTWWVFPVLADRPGELIVAMRAAGFDATQGASMGIVEAPAGREDTAPNIRELFGQIVYLPLYREMPPREVDRMADVLLEATDGTAGRGP